MAAAPQIPSSDPRQQTNTYVQPVVPDAPTTDKRNGLSKLPLGAEAADAAAAAALAAASGIPGLTVVPGRAGM